AENTGPLLKQWPDPGPRLLWKFDQLGIGYSSATVTDDAVFITGMEDEEGFVYALDLEGRLRWKASYGKEWGRSYSGSRSTPTYWNGRLYLTSGYGGAACFDAATGRQIWSIDMVERFGARNIKWGITESPLIIDNKVILTPGGPQAGVAAVHPDTGATIWTTAGVDDTSGYCSPIEITHAGQSIIVQLTGKTFIGIRPDTGKLLWRELRDPEPRYNIQAVSPVFDDGKFYLTSGYGGERGVMFQLNADGTGVTAEWRDSELDCHHGGLILLDGLIYGAADRNNRNQWICLNLQDGRVIEKIDGVGKGSLIYADGMLYTFAEKGMMGLVDPRPGNFRLVSSFKVPIGGQGPYWAHPSIAGGRLYLRHAETLFVYVIAEP
ncbi:MAG: PQQ-like beta-propeller repeat protein, partial [Lentisphaerae bacterium]|nr:PQQ-like beta-propeller repeat protein [Lentisphaerota bacterium]